MKRLLLAGAALLLPMNADAGVMIDVPAFCEAKDLMLDVLQPEFTGGEILAHAKSNGNPVRFYVNDTTGAWAMIFFPGPGGVACVINGDEFTPGAPDDEEPGKKT